MKTLFGKCLPGILALTIGIQSHAAIKYWDGNGVTAGAGTAPAGNWATSAFWGSAADGTSTPGTWVAGSDAVFSAGDDATGAYTVTLGSATASSITVEEGTVSLGGTGAVTIGTGTVTVNAGATLSTDSSARISSTPGSKLILKGGHKRTTNTGAAGSFVDVDMVIELQGGGTLSYTVPNVLNIVQTGVAISGTGPLTKSGVGVLAFANTCTYSGATIINDGELRIRTTANRLPTGTDVTVTSPGILNLNAVAQQIGSLSGNGNVGLAGATLTIGGATSTTFSGSIRPTANAGAGGSTALGGSVTKQGNGVLTLTGDNSYTGLLTLTAGGIQVEPGATLCDPVADVLINGGTLTLSNASQTIENLGGGGGTIILGTGHTLTINPINAARSSTYSGNITGDGGIAKIGATTESLFGANTYTGSTVIQEGKLVTTSASTGAGSYTVADGAVLGAKVATTGASLNMSELTIGTSEMEFDLAALGHPTAPVVKVNGDMAVNGTVVVNAKGFDTAGTFTLLEYTGTRTGGGSFILGNVPVRMFGNVIDDTANKRVIMEVTGGDSLIWVSDQNGFWDLNNPANEIWQLSTGGTPTYYQQNTMQGDTVRFDDTAIGNTVVTLNETLSPYSVTINNSSQDYTFSGAGKISGTAHVIKSGTRPLTILTTNDYSGGTTLNAATVIIGNNSVFGSGTVTINDAVLQSDSATARTLSMPVKLNGDLVAAETGNLTFQTGLWTIAGESREITVDSMTLAINSVITQDAAGRGIIKKGAGTLSLAAANSFSGGVAHEEGTLRVNSNNSLGATGSPVTLADGVTVSTTGGTGRTLNYGFTLNGNLTLGQASGGTASVTLAGTLNLAGGNRTINIVNASDVISAVISNGGLVKSGGNLDLTAANTFAGGLYHSEGTLRVNNNAALGLAGSSVILAPSVTLATTTTSARTLNYNFALEGDLTIGQATGGTAALTLAGSMNLGGATRTITIANSSDTISAAISNGGLVKAGSGTLVLSGANTYANGTTVNEGTLQGSTTSLQGNIVNHSTVTFNQSTAGTYAGDISGGGAVNKLGAGAVTFSGANSYSGNTTVSAGSLLINGTLSSANVSVANATLGGSGTIFAPVSFSNGFLSPGGSSIGTLALAGGLTLSNTTNTWQLGALKDDADGIAGVDFDQISLTGGGIDAGSSAVLAVSFTDSSVAPDFATPFWQTSHKWTVVKMNGGFNSGGTGFQMVVTGAPVHAGTFSTEVEFDGSLSLTFTPAGPTAPILLADLADKSVVQGSDVSFTIGVTGSAPLTYRWFFQGAEDFSQTSSSFTRIAAATSDAGQYYVIVANSHGSLTSAVATLTVLVPPSIQVQPESQNVEPGENVTFSVTAAGTAPFTYQWFFNGTNIVGATDSSYSVTGATTNNAGTYSVAVTNAAGFALSSEAILTVGSAGPSITSLTITNDTVTLIWTAVADRIYRAQFKPSLTATNWTDITPDVTATGSSASVTNPTAGDSQQFYRVLQLP